VKFITSTYVRYFALIVAIASIAALLGGKSFGRWP
jgi:hypothetical protein